MRDHGLPQAAVSAFGGVASRARAIGLAVKPNDESNQRLGLYPQAQFSAVANKAG
jgi:hypothetical protein